MEFFEFTAEQAEAVYDMIIKMFSLEGVGEIKKEYLKLKEIQRCREKGGVSNE